MATQNGHELDREAKAHMALAVLLQKNRPPAKREEVKRILESKLSTSAIVEAIRRLDSGDSGGGEGAHVEGESPVEAAQNENRLEEDDVHKGRAPNPFRLSLHKLKSILKRPRVRSPFFRYLFRELPRISEFGRATHVFAPLFLLPVLRLEQNIPQFLTESLNDWANELQSLLAPVLVAGWRRLTKKDYNTIVALDRLCREITTTNFRLFNLRDRNLIDKLRNLETLFLVFHYSSDTTDEAVRALAEVMTDDPELTEKTEQAEVLIRRILDPGFTIPSLYNLLLGLNMMKYRAAVSLNDLLTNDFGELFETESYACDPDIAAKIQSLVEELKLKIAKLHREGSRLKRLKDLVKIEPDSEQQELPEMVQLYERSSSTQSSRSFEEDRDNVMDCALNFFRRFESSCSALLSGSVALKGKGKRQIFAATTFQNELDRLRLTASKLERAAFGFRRFPYSRYLAIKRAGKGGVSTELEVITHLEDASSALVSIGSKLDQVLNSSRAAVSPAAGAQCDARGYRPIDRSFFQSGRAIALPYQEAVVADNSFLRSRTVRGAIEAVASVCLQSAVYFYEKPFVEALATERAIHERLERQLQTVRRIGDKAVYDQIVGLLLTPT